MVDALPKMYVSKWPNAGSVWVGNINGPSGGGWYWVCTSMDRMDGPFASSDKAKEEAEKRYRIARWITPPLVSMRGRFVAVGEGW